MTTGELLLKQADLQAARKAKFAGRKFINQVALVMSLLAMAFGLLWLFWILLDLSLIHI
jgi:phosphate transport system permease protein